MRHLHNDHLLPLMLRMIHQEPCIQNVQTAAYMNLLTLLAVPSHRLAATALLPAVISVINAAFDLVGDNKLLKIPANPRDYPDVYARRARVRSITEFSIQRRHGTDS